MSEQFSRTELIFGREAVEKLSQSRVAVFGLGGVGGFTAEALARSGVGTLDLFDNDIISVSNLNRQIFALHSTVGIKKTKAAKARLLDINPRLVINTHDVFYLPENSGLFDFSAYDYVVDAIDTFAAKIELVINSEKCGTPIISCMGTGCKTDPTRLEIADIYETSVCPVARIMRYELKKRGIKNLKVVYSKEKPLPCGNEFNERGKKIPGSTAFVPSAAGLIIAGEVVKDLISFAS